MGNPQFLLVIPQTDAHPLGRRDFDHHLPYALRRVQKCTIIHPLSTVNSSLFGLVSQQFYEYFARGVYIVASVLRRDLLSCRQALMTGYT